MIQPKQMDTYNVHNLQSKKLHLRHLKNKSYQHNFHFVNEHTDSTSFALGLAGGTPTVSVWMKRLQKYQLHFKCYSYFGASEKREMQETNG